MIKETLSVSRLLDLIKQELESEFREVYVEGEISNLTQSSLGHWYFTLSDSQSSLASVLFKFDSLKNPLIRKLKDGDKVICSGPISVYTKRGTFQLIAKSIVAIGAGNLMVQFEALKRKLAEQGLFDVTRKKRIPLFPRKIGIITALNGAALQDFITVFKRRCLWMDLVVIPAIVQGKEAPRSLIKALQRAQSHGKFDVLVLTRGGGSLEDLWAFNDESLARAIFACPIPVISAVGHHVDFTIADFVADYRAETPSAAAELLSAPQTQIGERLATSIRKLQTLKQLYLSRLEVRMQRCRPQMLLEKIWKNFFHYRERVLQGNLLRRIYELTRIHEFHFRLDEGLNSIVFSMQREFGQKKFMVENSYGLLNALDPNNVLKRGFSFIRDKNGTVIAKVAQYQQLRNQEEFQIIFSDGQGKGQKIESD